jgi:P-type Mg2+ transporter
MMDNRIVASVAVIDETPAALSATEAGALDVAAVLDHFGVGEGGLSAAEVARRRAVSGPNAIRASRARAWTVLQRQLRSPLLLLLLVTAAVSFAVGDRTDAVIIATILGVSVGLGFVNEFRAELAAEALHTQIRHQVVVRRDGHAETVDVTELVPGDRVRLVMGAVVAADLRLVAVNGLECDESVLTGESLPAEKSTDPVPPGSALGDLASCAFMGTVVRSGSGEGVVIATGTRTEFGRIAVGLGERQEETEFQAGLRHFSALLVQVAGVLTTSIFILNLILHRPLLESLLFSLAIAVGITPQLLPAVVTTSLATGSRRLAKKKVLVKRLVCIEDLGDIEVLLTDKTGTLTEGRISFEKAIDPSGQPSDSAFHLGLTCNEATLEGHTVIAGNALDVALVEACPTGDLARFSLKPDATLPFDHDRRLASVLVDDPDTGRVLVTKGAPEAVLAACDKVDDAARQTLEREFNAGSRVVAVATKAAPGLETLSPADEHGLTLVGYLVFLDRPKVDAAPSLQRLAKLGILVKVVTGDNALVAEKVCRDLDLEVRGVLNGPDIDALDDATLRARVAETTIFARVSPEQKSRLIRAHRAADRDVAFLGDGVNDAVALHAADVGISVESATDVAKDAADIVLLEKDLGVLADGVSEGRRTFANTIKYVLMGTSSNFGNMFSAATASLFLPFLPMLPSQILLNNLLYDSSQMTIPTDLTDPEMLARPSHWDIHFIRRFMLFFGPISSVFDFVTFGLMLGPFNAGPALFRSGWFVESLATQTLVVFVIRTRRVPFWKSRPSRPLLVAVLAVVAIGAYLPFSPFASELGFQALPATFFAALAGMVAAYLTIVELAKRRFFDRVPEPSHPEHTGTWRRRHTVRRRAPRWTHPHPVLPAPVPARPLGEPSPVP